jgi:hypothetical protein
VGGDGGMSRLVWLININLRKSVIIIDKGCEGEETELKHERSAGGSRRVSAEIFKWKTSRKHKS